MLSASVKNNPTIWSLPVFCFAQKAPVAFTHRRFQSREEQPDDLER